MNDPRTRNQPEIRVTRFWNVFKIRETESTRQKVLKRIKVTDARNEIKGKRDGDRNRGKDKAEGKRESKRHWKRMKKDESHRWEEAAANYKS